MHPLATYLRALHEIRSSGLSVPETSYYGTFEQLLNEIGKSLKPKVRCIINLKNKAPGSPTAGSSLPTSSSGGSVRPSRTTSSKGWFPPAGQSR